MNNQSIAAFNWRLRSLETTSACAALFRSVIEPLGFDTFASGVVDLGDRDRTVFHIIDWPERWRKFYLSSGMVNNDPVVIALAFRKDPFTWSELRADRKLAQAGREALDKVAEEGWNEGLVVPIVQGDDRIGIVSLSGCNPEVTRPTLDYLCVMSMLLHSHARALVPHVGFAVPPVGLTDREVACIQLVARGLPDQAIALELKIAISTAHEFVEKAKRRLKARSRAEMVAIAVSLGIITA